MKTSEQVIEVVASVLLENSGEGKMQDNREENRKILEIIGESIETNPELRFIQILWSLRLIDREGMEIRDRFYEPSKVTLERLEGTWQG